MKTQTKTTGSFLRSARNENGSTLIVFLVILVVLVTIASFALQSASLNTQSAGAFKYGRTSLYSAEAALDLAVRDIIDSYEALVPYPESVDIVGGNGFVSGPTLNGMDISYRITRPIETFLYQTVVANSIITHFAHPYVIEGHAQSTNDSLGTEDLKEEIRILETPLVQYFVFYGGGGDDAALEIHNGPNMNTWGRIHSNGNIYAGPWNSFVLSNHDTVTNALSPWSITASGQILPQRRLIDTCCINPTNFQVRIQNPNDPSDTGNLLEIPGGAGGGVLTDADEAPYNGYVLVQEPTLDAPSQTQFIRGALYEQMSQNPSDPKVDGMTITVDSSNNLTVTVSEPSTTDVTAQITAGTMPSGAPSITPPVALSSGDFFCDTREGGKWVDFIDIDLYLIWQWYDDYLANAGLTRGENGMLLYVSKSPDASFTNSGARLQAVRLVKRGTSPPQVGNKTTVATDNPIYIFGDFNTINTQGVALVGDAMNILSEGFTSRTNCTSNAPAAFADTNVYAAFFSGNVTASGAGPSGGLHNYPRFHESWSGRTLYIRGAFIKLWNSVQAPSPLPCCQPIYSPPVRQWGWDTRFNDPDFWPPYIPSVYSVERVGFVE